jgi:hypothetical protein
MMARSRPATASPEAAGLSDNRISSMTSLRDVEDLLDKLSSTEKLQVLKSSIGINSVQAL